MSKARETNNCKGTAGMGCKQADTAVKWAERVELRSIGVSVGWFATKHSQYHIVLAT